MQAFLINFRLVTIQAAKAGSQIEGQPVDLISLNTYLFKFFEDEVGAVPWISGLGVGLQEV